MKELKTITVKPSTKYELFADGESIGEFAKTSEWNGMRELKNADGTIIVSSEESVVDKMLSGIMGDEEEAKAASVIKVSPDLALKLFRS
jgi:hypothetical protein